MRDYLVLAIVFGSLPFCFARPHIGVLIFSWLGFMNPHRLSWGAAYSFPVAKWVAAATLLGAVFSRDRRPIPMKRETWLLLGLAAAYTLTSFFAIYPDRAWFQLQQVLKMLVIAFVTMAFFVDQARLRWLLLTIGLSIGFYGIKGAVFTVLTGGHYRIFGPPGTFMEDNNDLALALVMVTPVLFFLAQHTEQRWLRWGLWASVVMSLASVVFTYSRGGFLALAAVLLTLATFSRHRVLVIVVLVLAVSIGWAVIPGKWFERIATITDVEGYETEGSIRGRLNAWGYAWNLAKDHPLTGGGFGCFDPALFPIYAPDPDDVHDAHSIYFEVLGEHGYPGVTLFLLLLFSILFRLLGLRREFRRSEEHVWISDLATMLMLSFVGYMVGGAFLGRGYFDLTYQLVAIVVVLTALAEQRRAAEAPATEPQAVPLGAAAAGAPHLRGRV